MLKEKPPKVSIIGAVVFIGILLALRVFGPAIYSAIQNERFEDFLLENPTPIEFFVEPNYDQILPFHNGKAALIRGRNIYFVDTSGNIRRFDRTEDASFFDRYTRILRRQGHHGIQDFFGREMVFPQYRRIHSFVGESQYTVAGMGDLGQGIWEIVNRRGQVIHRLEERKYSDIGPFSEGLAPVVLRNGRYGYIDVNGDLVIDAEFNRVGHFFNGNAIVSRYGVNRGLIDIYGNVLVDFNYASLGHYSDGLIAFSRQTVLVNSRFHHDSNGNFRSDLTSQSSLPLYGFMDIDGNVVVEPQFVYTPIFARQMAMVAGTVFIESNAPVFSDGVAWVTPFDHELREASKIKYLIDTSGNILFELSNRYHASPSSEGFIVITDNMTGRQGIIRTPNRTI